MRINMSFYITTPYRSQLAGPDGPDEDDLTGCWYACAQMLGLFYDGNLNRIGVPELDTNYWKAKGLTPPRSGHFALGGKIRGEDSELIFERNEHLTPVPYNPNWVIGELEAVLRNNGPLIYFWNRPNSENTIAFGHACVIIGTDTDNVFQDVMYHDPEGAPDSRMSFSRFKELKQPVAMLMRIPGKDGKSPRHLEYRKKTLVKG
jgi:hypothetical protein